MGLFEEFDTVSHQDWIDKINIDLKGKNYKETLVWNSDEGIDIQPFYNNNLALNTTPPLKKNNDWKIRETIAIHGIEDANQKALLALKGGANSILFIGEIKDQSEMDALLKDIQTDIIEIHFYNSKPKHTSELISLSKGIISYDILSDCDNVKIDELIELITSTTNIKTITVKHINDTSIVKELAYNLSKGVEYLNLLTDRGIDANTIAAKMQFTFGISTNYFFEISKLRAARKLWQLVLEEYNVNDTSMVIHSETSIEKSSAEDENYEILRNTTKAMSAIIGGCDSLTVQPHDNKKLDFSNRIARNVQHILKEEAFFDKVNNPSDGAYYIEQLTEEIANKSWQMFQEIEQKCGFLACIKTKFIAS